MAVVADGCTASATMTFIPGIPYTNWQCVQGPGLLINRLGTSKEKEQVMSANKPVPQEIPQKPGLDEEKEKVVQTGDQTPIQRGENQPVAPKQDAPK